MLTCWLLAKRKDYELARYVKQNTWLIICCGFFFIIVPHAAMSSFYYTRSMVVIIKTTTTNYYDLFLSRRVSLSLSIHAKTISAFFQVHHIKCELCTLIIEREMQIAQSTHGRTDGARTYEPTRSLALRHILYIFHERARTLAHTHTRFAIRMNEYFINKIRANCDSSQQHVH